jgi:hypothetical protein
VQGVYPQTAWWRICFEKGFSIQAAHSLSAVTHTRYDVLKLIKVHESKGR